MESCFLYWDNSNILHEAQRLAEERDEGPEARYRVRINFENIRRLADAGRPVETAFLAGSVPPELRQLWNRLEADGWKVHLFDRGTRGRGEQEMPDHILQLRMLEDALDYNGDPGIAVLLSGDGAGYYEGAGFHRTLERMHKRGWRIEILSWAHSCNQRMRQWAERNGVFVALDDFYDSITFLEPSASAYLSASARESSELDLSKRPISPIRSGTGARLSSEAERGIIGRGPLTRTAATTDPLAAVRPRELDARAMESLWEIWRELEDWKRFDDVVERYTGLKPEEARGMVRAWNLARDRPVLREFVQSEPEGALALVDVAHSAGFDLASATDAQLREVLGRPPRLRRSAIHALVERAGTEKGAVLDSPSDPRSN